MDDNFPTKNDVNDAYAYIIARLIQDGRYSDLGIGKEKQRFTFYSTFHFSDVQTMNVEQIVQAWKQEIKWAAGVKRAFSASTHGR